ncbi:MAG: DUF6067 family protein [Candidatus Pacebacteria bacterium]|nr:DUF6067 family protein [Candidatus Paceibacterota bacterium]
MTTRPQIMVSRICGLTGVLLLLVGAAVHGADATRPTYERGALPKLAGLVRAQTPPTLDGIMEEGEWSEAAAVTGLTRVTGSGRTAGALLQYGLAPESLVNMAVDHSTFWITYDAENLYIAYHSPPPERIRNDAAMINVMLKKDQTKHDANLNWDDCVHLAVHGPEYPGGDKYVIQINALGVTFDCVWNSGYVWEKELLEKKLGDLPGITIAWDPDVRGASTLTLDGWFLEMSVPWEDFGPHLAPPNEGETWWINLGRNWQEIYQEGHAWAVDDGYSPAGQVVFQGDDGVIVQLEETGNLPRSIAAFEARLINRSQQERTLTASVTTDTGDLTDRKQFILAPGATEIYAFQGRISRSDTRSITFTVTDETAGRDVHVTALPVIRPTEPEFFVRRYRSRELMRFETDMAFLGAVELDRVRVRLTIAPSEGGRRVFRKTYRNLTSFEPHFGMSTEGWEPGDYEAEFVFTAPGRDPYTATVPCRYPPLPEWWNNDLGTTDMQQDVVPHPWTDMAVVEDTVSAWGREYRFGDRLMPEQITTLGYSILRAPVVLNMTIQDGAGLDGSERVDEKKWTKTNRTRVEGERTLETDALTVRNAFWGEYDGLLWYTLTFQPKRKLTVESLSVEIPFTPAFTDVINPCDYSLAETGALRPDGFAMAADRALWLGNGDGGLEWIPYPENTFHVQDSRRVLRVENGPDGATMYMQAVDKPLVLDDPYTIQFGLIATPVRPKITRIPYFDPRSLKNGGPWFPKAMEFMVAPDPGSDYYGGGRNGGRIYVHVSPLNVSPEALEKDAADDEAWLFADEFRANPTERTFERINVNKMAKAYRDYYVWRLWRYQLKYGFTGLYYDGTGGVSLGLRDLLKRLYNVTISNRHVGAREVNIGIHCSGRPLMAAMGFGTFWFDAENYNGKINAAQPTYLGVIDPALFRAEHMGHNFGLKNTFLGQNRLLPERVMANGGPEAVIDHLQGLELLHDCPPTGWHIPGPMGAVTRRAQDAWSRHNLSDWVFQFQPYWHQDIVELPDNENMHASFYIARPSVFHGISPRSSLQISRAAKRYFPKHIPGYMLGKDTIRPELKRLQGLSDKVVMVVYNNTDWEGEMRLKPDWKKIGLGPPNTLTAENAVHSTGFRIETVTNDNEEEVDKGVFFERPEETAKIENGELIFPMTRFNYRMIVLRKVSQGTP